MRNITRARLLSILTRPLGPARINFNGEKAARYCELITMTSTTAAVSDVNRRRVSLIRS